MKKLSNSLLLLQNWIFSCDGTGRRDESNVKLENVERIEPYFCKFRIEVCTFRSSNGKLMAVSVAFLTSSNVGNELFRD